MFFKKEKEGDSNNFLIKVCALLIHVAKIDEDYTENEEKIIKKTLAELGLDNEKILKTIYDAKIKYISQILNKAFKIYNIHIFFYH